MPGSHLTPAGAERRRRPAEMSMTDTTSVEQIAEDTLRELGHTPQADPVEHLKRVIGELQKDLATTGSTVVRLNTFTGADGRIHPAVLRYEQLMDASHTALTGLRNALTGGQTAPRPMETPPDVVGNGDSDGRR